MAPKVVDKQRKAEEIARAALPVFREVGYERARMADIAARAGVGKGTVYEYFKDKKEILRFELARYFADFEAGAAAAVMAERTAADRLAALISFSLRHVEAWEDHCAAFFDAVGSARVDEEGRAWFGAMFDEARGLIRLIFEEGQDSGELRRDIDAEAAAEVVISLYEGYVLLGILGVRCCDAERMGRELVQVLQKGVMAQ